MQQDTNPPGSAGNQDDLGIIKDVDVREVWRHEAHNFTPWLARNLGRLGQALHLDLEPLGTEAKVGPFYLDILAQETGPEGRKVAIENQLEGTDHIHLGQLLTYAAGQQAKIAIWIAPYFDEQHRAAIDWLNQWTLDEVEFYAVRVRAIRIDDSKPAPIFEPVAVPAGWPRLKQPVRSPRKESRGGFLIETKGCLLYTELGEQQAYVELWIAPDQADPDFLTTKHRIFSGLEDDKAEIQKEFPVGELNWYRRGNRHYAEIRLVRPASINDPPEKLAEIRAWIEETKVKFKEVFKPRVEKILAEMAAAEQGE